MRSQWLYVIHDALWCGSRFHDNSIFSDWWLILWKEWDFALPGGWSCCSLNVPDLLRAKCTSKLILRLERPRRFLWLTVLVLNCLWHHEKFPRHREGFMPDLDNGHVLWSTFLFSSLPTYKNDSPTRHTHICTHRYCYLSLASCLRAIKSPMSLTHALHVVRLGALSLHMCVCVCVWDGSRCVGVP